MNAASHPLTGAHACKWQSAAGIIRVWVRMREKRDKKTGRAVTPGAQRGFLMIQSHRGRPPRWRRETSSSLKKRFKKKQTSLVWTFQRLTIKKKTMWKIIISIFLYNRHVTIFRCYFCIFASSCCCYNKNRQCDQQRGFLSQTYRSNKGSVSESVVHSSHLHHDVTVRPVGGTAVLITHQGNCPQW